VGRAQPRRSRKIFGEVVGLDHTALAKFDASAGGKDDIHDAELREFVQAAARFVAQPRPLTKLTEILPQYISSEADQNMR